MNAHEIHALSGAYVVDALDPEERARFEEHLTACAACQAEVAELREAASRLGQLTEQVPSPGLRDRVLADIQTVRPLPPLATELDTRRRRPRWTGVVAAAAAAAAFFGGGAVVWAQFGEDSSQGTTPADEVIQARDAAHSTVDLPGGASATAYLSPSTNRVALVTRDMPSAPSGHVYQVWLQKDGHMVPAGLMRGGGDQAILLDGELDGATGAGITVEPSGGSEEPTTAPIALFDFERAT